MNGPASLLVASSRSIIDVDATFFVQVLLFFLCFLMLRALVFKPILRLIDERRAQTEGVRLASKESARLADIEQKRVTRQVQDTKMEAAAERERARLTAKRREQELLRKARDDASRLMDDARERTRKERERVAAEIDREADGIGAEMANRLAGRAL
jgi:F-type H+-transporting ATPase subunit b